MLYPRTELADLQAVLVSSSRQTCDLPLMEHITTMGRWTYVGMECWMGLPCLQQPAAADHATPVLAIGPGTPAGGHKQEWALQLQYACTQQKQPS